MPEGHAGRGRQRPVMRVCRRERHLPGGIMGLPMQSRSGDGSSSITATTGISVLEGTAPNL